MKANALQQSKADNPINVKSQQVKASDGLKSLISRFLSKDCLSAGGQSWFV